MRAKKYVGDRIMSLIHQCMSAISGKTKVMYSLLGIVVYLNYWLMHQVGHSTSTLLMRIIHFILLLNDCPNSMKSIDLLLLRKSDR